MSQNIIWKEFARGFDGQAATVSTMPDSHRHQDIELNFFCEDRATYLVNGRKISIPPERLTVFWAAIPHRLIQATPGGRFFWITIPLGWFLQWRLPTFLNDEILSGAFVVDEHEEFGDQESLKRWVADIASGKTHLSEAAILEIQARILRFQFRPPNKSKSPTLPKKAADATKAELMATHIARHYQEPLSLAQIARAASLHPHYATSLFRKTFGIGPMDDLTRHRVWHAQKLLATSDEKILNIALESGFGSLSRFYAAFASICGKSPRDYRRSVRV
ncbi:helix-turn-helix domain-containing protein [Kamptonema cortianum]|nr:helix-turn-helix domain-containing protein [Oscillatoria laete-virens]MDK3156400.1 helix-turn-helix domain-containing protein [Kamptonema cortianum]MDL5046257.1 helix-turn-helix domain-containing protein [Oscillatoria amoena NRMC-F 0135]MDL5053919.1 helix-turn-helix domain-containing protein [Oscillatoria laete-virens NRMC-F 0139]